MKSESNPNFNGNFTSEGSYYNSKIEWAFKFATCRNIEINAQESPYENWDFQNNVSVKRNKLGTYWELNHDVNYEAKIYTVSINNPINDPVPNSYGFTNPYSFPYNPISCIYTGKIRSSPPYYNKSIPFTISLVLIHEMGHTLGITGHGDHGGENNTCCVMGIEGNIPAICNNNDTAMSNSDITKFCGAHRCFIFNNN